MKFKFHFIFRVPLKQNLTQALETWGNESIERFFSPILQEESPATRSRRFKVFPNKLLIAPERYYKNSDWITEEYPVAMNVEDEIDLSWLKMSEDIKSDMEIDHGAPPATGTVKILIEMGFSEKLARKALDRTAWDIEAAAEWCCMHLDDPVEDNVVTAPPSGDQPNDDSSEEKPFEVPKDTLESEIKNDPIEFSTFEWTSRRFEFNGEEFERRARNYNPFEPTELQIQQLEMLGRDSRTTFTKVSVSRMSADP